jgi:hypothetical protein
MKAHHVFYGIVKREVGCVCRGYLAHSLRHRDEQFRQGVMVDDEIRHLEQRFIASELCVRIEVMICNQFARAQLNSPLGKRADYSARGRCYVRFF